MKSYVYVEAREVDGLISFDHVRIFAENEEEAYAYGPKAVSAKPDDDSGHSTGKFLNDYVFEV